MNRHISSLPGVMAALSIGIAASLGGDASGSLPEPFVTRLDMRPGDLSPYSSNTGSTANAIPKVIRGGDTEAPDQRQIAIPMVVTPTPRGNDDPGNTIGKAGTGFFIAADGTLLTAAHVVKDCGRTQVISRYVSRSWASVIASDDTHDIAVLKAMVQRPPAIVRVATVPPLSDRLFVLGYPASAGLTIAAETWGTTQNEKFPPNIGGLANPRELLWISAPEITHGYSGGPIFDPKLGAVVGIVKGEVEGGYLRPVRDIPTSGIAIGPGIVPLGMMLRRDAPAILSLASAPAPTDTNEDTLRRATVHVLCWR